MRKTMIFETHAHYDDEVFNEDRGQLLAGLPEKGIGRVINVGASIETTRTTLALAEAYDYIYAAVGVHPSDIDGLNEETYSWLKSADGTSEDGSGGRDWSGLLLGQGAGSTGSAAGMVRAPADTRRGNRSAGNYPLA